MKYRIDQITTFGKRIRGTHKYVSRGYAHKQATYREKMDSMKATYEVVDLLYQKWPVHYSYDKDEWTTGGLEIGQNEFYCEVYAECRDDALDEAKQRLQMLSEEAMKKEGVA